MARLDAGQAGRLAHAGGFVVESAEGELGWVEEIWFGEDDEPSALAVCTGNGRRGLIFAEDVLAVDEEYEWVVVRPQPTLLELAPPRLARADGESVVASWATTGETIPATPVRVGRRFRRNAVRVGRSGGGGDETPVGQTIAVLYGGIVLLAALMMISAFVIAKIVTGAAY